MYISEFNIKRTLMEFILFINFVFVFPRSVPTVNQRSTTKFEHHSQGSLALHPLYYDHSNLHAYRLHEPVGTFYDNKRGILRTFPGGGVPVLVDHHKRCSNNFVGIKPHPNQRQYYYVCKHDCVIFGKCQNLQSFDATKAHCIPYTTPDYKPVCRKPGIFPILTDCTIYYRCDAQLKPRIFSCPRNTVFSPHNEKCICGAHCNPTKVLNDGSHIPQDSENKFPPCLQNGTYRTPTDCALYYTCAKQHGALYLQTRFKCPELEFFDPARGTCRPQHEVACDSIQLSELVFPRPPPISHLPVIYPAHYSLESLDDSEYPTEYSLFCSKEDTVSVSVGSSEGASLDSSAQTTKPAKSSTMTTVTTALPSHSTIPKSASPLTISSSTLKIDDINSSMPVPSSTLINTPTPNSLPTSTIGTKSKNSALESNFILPIATMEEVNFSSSFSSTAIADNSPDYISTSKDVTPESFPSKAFPTAYSISSGVSSSTASLLNPSIASSVTTLSPDIISGPTSSRINFLSSNLQIEESLSPISFSTTTSPKDSTLLPVIASDDATINDILALAAEITTTPVVSTSLNPLPPTGVSTSTTKNFSFPTTAHARSHLTNKVDNSSPNDNSSAIEMIPTTAFASFTSPPIKDFPLNATTSEQATIHSSTLFVETATQFSMPNDTSMSSSRTSNRREGTTTMSTNTSLILRDSPPIKPIEVTNKMNVKPTISSLFSADLTQNKLVSKKTPTTILSTLHQNEVRNIRSSLSTASVTAEENHTIEKEVNTEYNSNEFEIHGDYADYEFGCEPTLISTTDKPEQNELLDNNIKPLNASTLIMNTNNINNKTVKATECINNDSPDSRFSNDVSYYEDNGDSIEVLATSTISDPHIKTSPRSQSTSFQLNVTPLNTHAAKRYATNYKFQIHNQSNQPKAYKFLLVKPNKQDIFNLENNVFKYSTENKQKKINTVHNEMNDDLITTTEKINKPLNNSKLDISNSGDSTVTFVTAAQSDTEASKCDIHSIEDSTMISSNDYELGSNINIAITTPLLQTVSSITTDNNLIEKKGANLHVENSMSAMQSLDLQIAKQSTATVVENFTESNLSNTSTTTALTGYIATVSTYEDSGDSQEKILNKNEWFSKRTTSARLKKSATEAHPIINNIDKNLITNNELQILAENSTKIKKVEEITRSSNSSSTVNGRDDTEFPQAVTRAVKKELQAFATTEPTTFKVARQTMNQINNSVKYLNEYLTSSEDGMFMTESSPEALFTPKSAIEDENIVDAKAEVMLTERLCNKHPHTPKNLLKIHMKSLTAPTATIENHTTYHGQEASAKILFTSRTVVNCDEARSSGGQKQDELEDVNNTNHIYACGSKLPAIVSSTFSPIGNVVIENNKNSKKTDPISKQVDIMLIPQTQKSCKKNKIITEHINFSKNYIDQVKSHTYPQHLKMNRTLDYAKTVGTLTETQNPKEIVNHFESASINVMKPAERKKILDSFERSTGLLKTKSGFQNYNSNKRDNQIIPQSPNSKSKPLRTNGIFKTRTSDLPLSSSKILTTILSKSTTTPNSIISAKNEYQEDTTLGTTHLDIKFHNNLVNIEPNDWRIARNVPSTNTLQGTPQTFNGIYRTQTGVSNSKFETVTEYPIHTNDIPKLEVVVFGNLDLTVVYCPKRCSKQHEHNYDKKVSGDQHVVDIQWDPAMSKKTMSIQTV